MQFKYKISLKQQPFFESLGSILFSTSTIKSPILKTNIKGCKNSSGRNNLGVITSFHKGGGHKQSYRFIDFTLQNNFTGIVMSIEYDPNRTANIAAVYCKKLKKYCYILAPKGLQVGNIVRGGEQALLKLGHNLTIDKIPLGSIIFNISFNKKKGIVSRSAGSFSQLLEKTLTHGVIKVSSGKLVMVSLDNKAFLGKVSNEEFLSRKKRKAGQSRWLNIRPTVRGVAMNPIDHPHGGGEGKTSKKAAPRTPWGKFVRCGNTKK